MINLPDEVNLEELLSFLKKVGKESSIILRNFENQSIPLYDSIEDSSNYKNKEAPVTKADLAINQLILDRFSENYPNIDWEIITEENTKVNGFENSKSDWVWLIDPLDGTKDFIQKTGEYAVHIALNYKNNPILGIVVLPSLDEIWFGVENLGTWKETQNTKLGSSKFQSFTKLKANTLVTSKNHINKKLSKIINELEFKNIIKMGSIGFKICSLLRKEADIYISISDKTSPKDWDLAAPHILIKSAGNNFTNVLGGNLKYGEENYEQKGCLICSTLTKSEHMNFCSEVYEIIEQNNF
tara:strand:- start:25 stop:918 length:894 start_codon:yes stop_codon:yes gene_type:complete